MLLIVYDTKTKHVEKFIKKVLLQDPNLRAVKIEEGMIIQEVFVFVTYTAGRGELSLSSSEFLKNNSNNIQAVAASGNRNFGSDFAKSADIVSSMYRVPILHKFEFNGLNSDIQTFIREVNTRFIQKAS